MSPGISQGEPQLLELAPIIIFVMKGVTPIATVFYRVMEYYKTQFLCEAGFLGALWRILWVE